MHFLDLREDFCQEYLDAFIALYNQTFINTTEREDPGQWERRLHETPEPPQPILHLLLVLEAKTRNVVGGLVFEHYRESACGLLTYLVVEPSYRGKGLARNLIGRALGTLSHEAVNDGRPLKAVFAECENPEMCSRASGGMRPAERVQVLKRLGARKVAFPYVQPQLKGGSGRCRHLMMLILYVEGDDQGQVDGEVVRCFLQK